MAQNQPLDIAIDPTQPASPQGGRTTRKAANGASPKRTQQKSKKSKPTGAEKLISNLKSERTRLGVGITLSILAVTILIMLLSFLKTGSIDQSVAAGGTIAQIADAPEGVANAGGALGAKVSHLLFVDGLGVGSFILAFYLGGLALALFRVVKIKFWSFTFKCLFTSIALSVILGLFTYNSESFYHWGGNHGRYVNQWLYHVSDAIGAFAVSIFLIGMLVVIYLHYFKSAYSVASSTFAKRRSEDDDDDETTDAPEEKLTDLDSLPGLPESGKDEGQTVPFGTVKTADRHNAPRTHGFSIDDEEDDATGEGDSAIPEQKENYAGHEFSIDEPDDGIEMKINSGTPGDASVQTEFDELTANDFEPYDIRADLSHYKFPTPDLLEDRPVKVSIDREEQEENKKLIVDTLKSYDIPISRIEATIGPTVTLYEIVPGEGVRISQIKRLEDDIALSLAALGIRIIAPMPGKGTVGIEVPNRDPQTISLFSVINSKKFRETNMALPMAIGSTINNDIFIADLAKMPHLLVAGATGQGKSVGLNCIIASLLYKKHPAELKFVLIDPKMVEFSLYSRLEKHFLAKLPEEDDAIVTDPAKALTTLASICVEMDNRYNLLKTASVRTVEEYNRKFTSRRLNPEKGHKFMPYIVVIVDEFADLIMTAGKDISIHIARIAQKARAVGIHMIIATQRPSTDIITGMIKANFPGRIAFRVAQMVDSKTILDRPGANQLIGRGDLLFSHNSKMERVQCAFIDTPEVERLVEFVDNQIGYSSAYILPEPEREGGIVPGAIDLSKRDEQFDDCARFVVQNTTASTSSLQRRFGIGYNKAGKIMDQLEAAGIVGPADGQKPRQVLVDHIQLEEILRGLG